MSTFRDKISGIPGQIITYYVVPPLPTQLHNWVRVKRQWIDVPMIRDSRRYSPSWVEPKGRFATMRPFQEDI